MDHLGPRMMPEAQRTSGKVPARRPERRCRRGYGRMSLRTGGKNFERRLPLSY
jgi:hypothetical protein